MKNRKITNLRGSIKLPGELQSLLESANKIHLSSAFWHPDQIDLLKLHGTQYAELISQLDNTFQLKIMCSNKSIMPDKMLREAYEIVLTSDYIQLEAMDKLEAVHKSVFSARESNSIRFGKSIKNEFQLAALDELLWNCKNNYPVLSLAADFDSQEKLYLLTQMRPEKQCDDKFLKILLITGDLSLIERIESSFYASMLLDKLNDPQFNPTLLKLLTATLEFNLIYQFLEHERHGIPFQLSALKILIDKHNTLTSEIGWLALRFDSFPLLEALELGVSPELALKFRIDSIAALKVLSNGTPPTDEMAKLALHFYDKNQVEALELGVRADLALPFTTLSIAALKVLSNGTPPTDEMAKLALRFYDKNQVEALELGVSPHLALDFRKPHQVSALEILSQGKTVTDSLASSALCFINEYRITALKLGVSPHLAARFYLIHAEALKISSQGKTVTDSLASSALKFSYHSQIEALTLGVTPQLALQFKTQHTIDALKALRNQDIPLTDELVELVVRFDNEHQVEALELGITPELALQFKTLDSINKLITDELAKLALPPVDNKPKVENLELVVSPESVHRFDNKHQLKALTLGVTPQLALQFKTQHSIDALKALRNQDIPLTDELVELVVRFDNEHQIKALALGVSPQLALEYKADYQVKLTIDTINREGAYNYSYAPNEYTLEAYQILAYKHQGYDKFYMEFSTNQLLIDLREIAIHFSTQGFRNEILCHELLQEYINTRDLDAALHFDKCPYVKNEQLDQRDCPSLLESTLNDAVIEIMSSFSAPCINKIYTELVLSNALSDGTRTLGPSVMYMKARGAQCVDVPERLSVEDVEDLEDAAFLEWETHKGILFACNLCGELESFVVEQ